MLVDANLLIYAVDRRSPSHVPARKWVETVLNGADAVAIPWQSIGAFLRVVTHRRAFPEPLAPAVAWAHVTGWLAAGPVWTPVPGPRYAGLLGELIQRHLPVGDLVVDAQLAALALEHGLAVASADTDFARFTEIEWVNPVAP